MTPILKTLQLLFPNAIKLRLLLEGKITIRKYKKGDLLVTSGETNTDCFFIYKGLIRAFCEDEDKQAITIWFMHENKFAYSLKSYVTDGQSNISIQAIEDCTVIVFKKEIMEYAFANYLEANSIFRKFANHTMQELEETAILLQSKSAIGRYQKLLDTKSWVIQRAPLGYVASYLGITQSTLSRMRAKIQQK
jgi:CRP/FNR family transcriptional regulator, anaerobic regulatory protein